MLEEDGVFVLALTIPLVAMIGGFMLAALGLYRRARLKELAYRERIAMIERGLMPPPETDPARFETMTRPTGSLDRDLVRQAIKRRTAGIILIGIGLALAMIIAFGGDAPGAAIGVGGGIAVLGLAFVVNSLLDLRQPQTAPFSTNPDGPRSNDRNPAGPPDIR